MIKKIYPTLCNWGITRPRWLQTTQPTSGGAVTVVSSCCANCVEPPRLEEFKLLIHDTLADIITIQETKLTPKAKTPKKYITSHQCAPIGCTRQEVGSLETTSHSLQQTYLRLLIHTT